MLTVTVDEKFGLVLDEEMYELALVGLRSYAPEQVDSFTWERFVTRESWVLVPDTEHPDEPFYKAEFVIKHGHPYLQTVKLNLWRSPDLRRDGAPMPHNHPWPFTGHLLCGGYVEDRYELALDHDRDRILVDPHSMWNVEDMILESAVAHGTGESNYIGLATFHEVTQIIEPGRTLSLMDCNLGRKEGWGHLEPNAQGKLVYVPNKLGELDATFKPMLLDRNPHLARK